LARKGSLGMSWLGRPDANGIEVGQRFISTDRRKLLWEVVDVSHFGDEPIPHVRLARVGAPQDTKTVSAGVLTDRRYFRYVSPE
jgi:hypothetical protein